MTISRVSIIDRFRTTNRDKDYYSRIRPASTWKLLESGALFYVTAYYEPYIEDNPAEDCFDFKWA